MWFSVWVMSESGRVCMIRASTFGAQRSEGQRRAGQRCQGGTRAKSGAVENLHLTIPVFAMHLKVLEHMVLPNGPLRCRPFHGHHVGLNLFRLEPFHLRKHPVPRRPRGRPPGDHPAPPDVGRPDDPRGGGEGEHEGIIVLKSWLGTVT